MSRSRKPASALTRALDRLFDRFSARPVSLLVFLGSVALLVYLQTFSFGSFRVRAIAQAGLVAHPAHVSSFVTRVFVRPGDHVEVGAPLVELSSYFIDRERAQLDAEIEQLIHESKLAQARLLVEEERWLQPSLRIRPETPSLQSPTEAFYASQLDVLQTRRDALLEDRDRLTIAGGTTGRVISIAPLGSSIATGASVAAVTPDFAEEIIAYVPAETDPAAIAEGAQVQIVQPMMACAQLARVLRRGAGVEPAPGQLADLFRMPVHGMPVFISVPESCRFAVGQVLSVEFPRARM
jgi:multidrug efflux pump subunit AcrA (membrane-fusion protein)